jgi:hypothetical protein
VPHRVRHLHLVPPRVSDETVRALTKLLNAARKGDVVGIAFVAVCHKTFFVDAAGIARDRPTLARGMLGNLEDLLSDLQGGRDGPRR